MQKWRVRDWCIVMNGILGEGSPWRTYAPRKARLAMLTFFHDHDLAGHLSAEQMRAIDYHYHWPGMVWDTRKYVKECQVCQQYKGRRGDGMEQQHFCIPSRQFQFQTITLDVMGFAPSDCTCWVVAYAPEQFAYCKSRGCARAAIHHLGIPMIHPLGQLDTIHKQELRVCLQDNHTQWEEHPVQRLYCLQRLTTVYTPAEWYAREEKPQMKGNEREAIRESELHAVFQHHAEYVQQITLVTNRPPSTLRVRN
ncbi:hypothetical protein PR048_001913 [Dryococelus australis]|uniref:Integrase zinc-binding domain-containing protein n=1 Tax=Dryococelus australis TaxID=614101 RepID=A0ABQ9IIN2_9NEOP|nr:hypothetical protein PR048_001913 [Dryococelus australis]